MWAKIKNGSYIPLEGKGFTVADYDVKGQKEKLYRIIAIGHISSSPFASTGFKFVLSDEIQTRIKAQKILDALIVTIYESHNRSKGFYDCEVCDMEELVKACEKMKGGE